MNITTEPELPAETPLPTRRPLPNILVQGFSLARRNWYIVVWAYAINLVFGLLAGIPFSGGLAPFLDHSLAAQRIAGTIDLGTLSELVLQLREPHLIPIAFHTAVWLNLLQLLILFLLFAGTVFVYVAGEPPQVSVLLRGGVAYFWRFVRAAILVGCVSALILGLLLTARAALLARLALVNVGHAMFVYAEITGAIVFLVAFLLRLWFDLVEVYIVRNAMDGERRAHRALLPAYKLLIRYFFRIFGGFLLIGFAAVCALGLCLFLWKSLPANLVWLAALLAQVGLFLLLAGRFWQRGLEAALVLAADPPVIISEVIVAVVEEEEAPSLVGVAGLSGLSEPTLRELVQKLQTEPWANPPDAAAKPTAAALPASAEVKPVALSPDPQPAPDPFAMLGNSEEGPPSPIELHATKFPLGGIVTPKEVPPASEAETVTSPDTPGDPPQTEKPPA